MGSLNPHLDAAQLERFRNGTLTPDEVLFVAGHLGECVECRTVIDVEGDTRRLWERLNSSAAADHLREDELVAYVRGTMPEAEADAARAHVAECEICAEDVADLEQVRDSMKVTSFPARRWLPYAIAAALAIVLFASLFVGTRTTIVQQPPVVEQSPTPAPTPAPATAVEPNPVVTKWRAIADVALQRGAIERPAIVASLQSGNETMRGPEASSEARVIAPVGLVVDEVRPEFRWKGISGSSAVVSVLADADVVTRSSSLSVESWRPGKDLRRGVTYTWQVALTTEQGRTIVPAPPEPPARFVVLGEKPHRELQEALAWIDDPLTRGVVCAHFGLQQCAVDELEKAGHDALATSVREWTN